MSKLNHRYAYVAGRFGDYDLVRQVQQVLESEGYGITFDWTQVAERVMGLEPSEPDPNYFANNAALDLIGVLDADLVVLVCHPDGMDNAMGCYIELGMALGSGIMCHVINPPRDCVFFHRPRVRVFNDMKEWLDFFLLGVYPNV